jgi:hypothetical protein
MQQAEQYGWIRVRIEVVRPATGTAAETEALPEVTGFTRWHIAPDGTVIFGVSVPNL